MTKDPMQELICAAEDLLLPQLESNLRSNAPAWIWGITMTVPEMQRLRAAIAAAKAAPSPRAEPTPQEIYDGWKATGPTTFGLTEGAHPSGASSIGQDTRMPGVASQGTGEAGSIPAVPPISHAESEPAPCYRSDESIEEPGMDAVPSDDDEAEIDKLNLQEPPVINLSNLPRRKPKFHFDEPPSEPEPSDDAIIEEMSRTITSLAAAKAKAEGERDEARKQVKTQFSAAFATLRATLGADLGTGGGLVEILEGIENLREQRDEAREELECERHNQIVTLGILDEAREKLAAAEARIAYTDRDIASFRETHTRILDALGCKNLFAADETLVGEILRFKARIAELEDNTAPDEKLRKLAADLEDKQ